MVGMWPGPWQAGVGSTPPTALTRLSSWIPITDALSEGRAASAFLYTGSVFSLAAPGAAQLHTLIRARAQETPDTALTP